MTIHLPFSLKNDTCERHYLNLAYRFSIECSNKLLTVTNAIIGLSMRKHPLTIQDVYSLEVSFSDLIAVLRLIRDQTLDKDLMSALRNNN